MSEYRDIVIPWLIGLSIIPVAIVLLAAAFALAGWLLA